MRPDPDLRAVQLVARSLFRDLVADGLELRDILLLAAELVDHVAEHKAERRSDVAHDHAERDLTLRLP